MACCGAQELCSSCPDGKSQGEPERFWLRPPPLFWSLTSVTVSTRLLSETFFFYHNPDLLHLIHPQPSTTTPCSLPGGLPTFHSPISVILSYTSFVVRLVDDIGSVIRADTLFTFRHSRLTNQEISNDVVHDYLFRGSWNILIESTNIPVFLVGI